MLKRILLSLALLAGALGLAHAVNINGVNETSRNQVVNVGYLRMSVTDTITAFAGGGQTSAVLLTSSFNRVSVVASANDSVKLPICTSTGPTTGVGAGQPTKTLGMVMYVVNAAAANSMNVFPSSGGLINALSADSAYAVAANKTVGFICSGTIWYSILGS
jgi:hypothetical protein